MESSSVCAEQNAFGTGQSVWHEARCVASDRGCRRCIHRQVVLVIHICVETGEVIHKNAYKPVDNSKITLHNEHSVKQTDATICECVGFMRYARRVVTY